MDKAAVYKLLEVHKNERGIENWKKFKYRDWTSFGIGLTQLKSLAKQLGKNHKLALELWQEPNYDLKTLAILIDDPKKVDSTQIESMVNDVGMWMMSHTWVQNLFSKVPFAKDLATDWRLSKNDVKRRCGFAFLYYLAKDKKVGDAYFLPILSEIESRIQQEENFVKEAMNNVLFSVGQRSKLLNRRCIEIATTIGQITVDYGDNSCEAVDVIKHLTSERIQVKLN